jgi:hypothetical protein
MSRTAVPMWLGVSLLLATCGCAHMVETSALERFGEALALKQSENALDRLKDATSDEFAQLALRNDAAVDDLKILHLPTEKPEILSVKDVSETEKLVTVEAGPAKKRVEYRLVRDEATKKWVVDDVYLEQKKDGVKAVRSVTEQMDLLLSVREFLRAWSGTDRKDILEVAAPKLRGTLDGLPPAYLAQLTQQVVGDTVKQDRIRPEAQLDEDVAVVKVPRKNGQLMMNLRLVKGRWLVSDLSVEMRGGDGIPSVQKHTIALTAAVGFLRAYNSQDMEALAGFCTPKFYRSGLAPADLGSVPLPTAELPAPGQQFRVIATRAELVIPTETEKVKLSLVREEAADADSQVRYFVEDVSLHDLADGGERRLSSMFTAHAVLDLFTGALARRDLPTLRKTSTGDFNRRVWERLKQSGPPGTVPLASGTSHTTLDDLPLGDIPGVAPDILETNYNGAVTEVRVKQGTQELTYLLRETGGEVRLDDVLLPAEHEPRSLKETTELIVPMREFMAGLETGDLALIQRTSSNDYNKLVWKQTDKVPLAAQVALEHLSLRVTGVKATPEEVTITLGNERWGARVLLVREHSQHVVDEIHIIRGLEASQRLKMKQAMRLELAGASRLDVRQMTGGAPRNPARNSGISNLRYEEDADEPHAGLMPPEPADDAFETPDDDAPSLMPDVEALPVRTADDADFDEPTLEMSRVQQTNAVAEPELEEPLPAVDEPAPATSAASYETVRPAPDSKSKEKVKVIRPKKPVSRRPAK